MGPLERVREVAVRVAASYGLDIFDVELRREGGQQVLRVVLDRPGPNATAEESVSLEDCARVSEELSTILDVEDVALADRYTLEVSSPGLDRPLRHAEDYRRFAGRRAKIVMSRSRSAGRPRSPVGCRASTATTCCSNRRAASWCDLPLRLISRARLDVEF